MLSASFLFALLWEDGAKQLLDIGRGQRLSAVACHPVLGGKLIGVIRKLHQIAGRCSRGHTWVTVKASCGAEMEIFPAGSVLLDGNLGHRADQIGPVGLGGDKVPQRIQHPDLPAIGGGQLLHRLQNVRGGCR